MSFMVCLNFIILKQCRYIYTHLFEMCYAGTICSPKTVNFESFTY